MQSTKHCAVCQMEQSAKEFYTARRGTKSECKACSRAEIERLVNAGEPKICVGCGEKRHPKDFYGDRGKLAPRCKDCAKMAQKAYNSGSGKPVRELYRATLARGHSVVKYNRTIKAKAARARWRRTVKSVEYRLIESHRRTMNHAMRCYGHSRKKAGHTTELLGCSLGGFRAHIEQQWQPGMNWDNRGVGPGKWQIDHIRPLASFDLTISEQQREAFCYKNQQPLWHSDNAKKSDMMPDGSRGRLLRIM